MKIKCPNCGDIFDLSENETAEIIKQVRNAEFDAEIASYKERFEAEKSAALKLAEAEAAAKTNEALAKKDAEIADFTSRLNSAESEKNLAVAQATTAMQSEISELKNKITQITAENQIAITEAVAGKQTEIAELKAKLEASATSEKLAVTEAVAEADRKYLEIIKGKDEEIETQKQEVAYYRDLKARKSTKAIGESLELHCQDDFDMHLRSVLPQGVYFEKDNEISESGSKGDYIYREEMDGIPLLSIMFEMKNDSEETENRHKNEYFFKELDKDRKEKGCEYAVLVSLLESDSEYYNQGIVDVSHRYPKMFVIRPQFLIPLITLLRNASLSAHSSKLELEQIREQNIDVTNFETKLNDFKDGFSKSCMLTGKKFNDAIDQIDKAIKDLEKVKEALTASGKHLIAADNQLEDLSIKKLTYKNPTMKAKFDEARKASDKADD